MSRPQLMFERAVPHDISKFREPGSPLPFRNTHPDHPAVSNAHTPLSFSSTIHTPKHGPPHSHPPRVVSPSTQRPTSKQQHYDPNMESTHSQTTMSSHERNTSRDDFLRTRRSSHTSDSSVELVTATKGQRKDYTRARRQSTEMARWRRQDDEDYPDSNDDPISYNVEFTAEFVDDDDDSHEGDNVISRSETQFPPLLPSVSRRTGNFRNARDRVTGAQLAERFAKRREELRLPVPTSDADSATSGDGDEIAVSWSRYRAQREKIQDLRKEMALLRPNIRNLGRLRDGADNDFMGMVRYYATLGEPTPIPPDLLEKQFRKLQTRRTQFHEAETAYEQLETELEREESFFEVVEAQFFSLLYQDTQQFAPDDPEKAPSRPVSLRGISAERPTAGDPLYNDLTDAIGDKDLAKEHLSEIVHERDRILFLLDQRLKIEQVKGVEGNPNRDIRPSEKDLAVLKMTISNLSDEALRRRFGSYIKEGDLEFLRDFESTAADARRQVKDTTDKVARLKRLCLEKGIIDSEDETALRNGTLDLSDRPRLVDGLGHPLFHILMSNPKHLLGSEPQVAKVALQEANELPRDDPRHEELVRALHKEVGIETLLREFTEEDKSDYINRWLLHRVVNSPLEVANLWNVFSMRLRVRDLLRWQHDVIYYWKRDGANVPPTELKGPLTSLDSWQVVEENTARINHDINGPSRAGSDGYDSHVRKSQLERLESASQP